MNSLYLHVKCDKTETRDTYKNAFENWCIHSKYKRIKDSNSIKVRKGFIFH